MVHHKRSVNGTNYAGANLPIYNRESDNVIERVNKALEAWDSPKTINSEIFQTVGMNIDDLYGQNPKHDRNNIEPELPIEKFRIRRSEKYLARIF